VTALTHLIERLPYPLSNCRSDGHAGEGTPARPVGTDPDVIVIHSCRSSMSDERNEPRDEIRLTQQKGRKVLRDGARPSATRARSGPARESLPGGKPARRFPAGVTFSQLMVFTGSRSEPWWVQTLSWRPRGWFPGASLFSIAFTSAPPSAHLLEHLLETFKRVFGYPRGISEFTLDDPPSARRSVTWTTPNGVGAAKPSREGLFSLPFAASADGKFLPPHMRDWRIPREWR
jgi:hypothetical protein